MRGNARAIEIMLGAQTVGGAFGKFAALQREGRPGLTHRGRSRMEHPRHARADFPLPSRPLPSNSGALAAGFLVTGPHGMPLSRQRFTGVPSPVTLSLRKRRKEGTWFPQSVQKRPL